VGLSQIYWFEPYSNTEDTPEVNLFAKKRQRLAIAPQVLRLGEQTPKVDPYKQGLCRWSVSVCKQMCKQIQGFKGSDLSLFGFHNQRIFGTTI
jgi:hypothetical protein